ncbi:MAG TPA: DNA polymerase IV [Candidatus Paceibacterota bacterium]
MKYIIHVDGDAFFASCEISRRPDLKGKPVVVGEERGIVSAYTYEAKALGIGRAMPIFELKKNFPQVTILPAHFELYEGYQRKLTSLLRRYMPVVETYSIDECFAEMEFSEEEIQAGRHEEWLKQMKSFIQESLGITLSFGLAKTKTLAKVASKIKKPDGCTVFIDEAYIKETLSKLLIGSIWGIGNETSKALVSHNILTAGQFTEKTLAWVEQHFSEPVVHTWYELNGHVQNEVSSKREDRKSIQSTRSLSYKTQDRELLFSELSRNVELACAQLVASGQYTDRVHVFYRCVTEFSKYRKSIAISLGAFTQDPSYVLRHVKLHEPELYDRSLFFKSTGITLSNLRRENLVQHDLFGKQIDQSADEAHLKTISELQHKFGSWSLMRASSLKSVQLRTKDSAKRDSRDSYEYGLPLTYMGEVS